MTAEDFAKLGREHALVAIDQITDNPSARADYYDNLGDTLAENYPDATRNQIAICFDAYDATWEARP